MRTYPNPKWLATIAAFVIGSLSLPHTARAQETVAQTEGIEVLTRGPVHEAFAETISYDPQVGMIVDKEPPGPIEEVPPEQEMEGDNVTWIPGYWGWDDEQNDFLWISGIWRNLPPEREWVPGYWAGIDDGKYQWTSGYWQDAEIEQVSYLPEPPKSLERGPSAKAVSHDQTWIPGSWLYQEDRYAWRPGNWTQARTNWIWVPAYYRWTPRGYVYVDGYWDYPVARRGVVFAPVRIQREYYTRPNYIYTPATVIALAVFTNHLFVRPHYDHYYFGDYYEPRYRDNGYYASYSYSSSHHGYDPIYSHQRWEHRDDRNWENQRREYFEYRRDNESARPPRSWSALASRQDNDRKNGDYRTVERFDRVVANRADDRQKFRKVDEKDRERFVSQRQDIRKFSKAREESEVRGKISDKDLKTAPVEQIRRSPVISEKRDRSKKVSAPPERVQPREKDRVANRQKERNQPREDTKSNPDGKDTAPKDPAAEVNKRPDRADAKDRKDRTPETRTEPGKRRDMEKSKGQPSDLKGSTVPEGTKEAKPTAPKDRAAENRTDPKKRRDAEQPKDQPQVPKDRSEPDKAKDLPAGRKDRATAPTTEPARRRERGEPKDLKPAEPKKTEPTPERKPRPDVAVKPNEKRKTETIRPAEPQRERKIDRPAPEPQPKQRVQPEERRRTEPTPPRQQERTPAPQPERKKSIERPVAPPREAERRAPTREATPRIEQAPTRRVDPRTEDRSTRKDERDPGDSAKKKKN